MSNETTAERRAHLAKAIKHTDAERAALMAQRDRNPHSVDAHSFSDVGKRGAVLMREFLSIGGNRSDIYPPTRTRKQK